jgi:hypothetical protein
MVFHVKHSPKPQDGALFHVKHHGGDGGDGQPQGGGPAAPSGNGDRRRTDLPSIQTWLPEVSVSRLYG